MKKIFVLLFIILMMAGCVEIDQIKPNDIGEKGNIYFITDTTTN